MSKGFECPYCHSRDTYPKETINQTPTMKVRRHCCRDCGRGFRATESVNHVMAEIVQIADRLTELERRVQKEEKEKVHS